MIQSDTRLCRSCRWWSRINEYIGECRCNNEARCYRPGIEFRWSGDNCREEVLMDTTPDFGCVLWEEADNDQS